jgi:hypothetical protein
MRPNLSKLLRSTAILTLLCACTQVPNSCPASISTDSSITGVSFPDPETTFQYPLDGLPPDSGSYFTQFAAPSLPPGPGQAYHAAEDYLMPAGTPVFAIADGIVSYSGLTGGYGWLIIIDHPRANLYSLYGHLSPSRWNIGLGEVEKGELIAYLGDEDENGGSPEYPLTPHLHFGVRAGQRKDYPGRGEWRWMAGWIKYCPQDLGWLQPSLVIKSQGLPEEGYLSPKVDFLTAWGTEILITSMYLISAPGFIIYAYRKKKPWMIVAAGIFYCLAWYILSHKSIISTQILLVAGILMLSYGLSKYIPYQWKSSNSPHSR